LRLVRKLRREEVRALADHENTEHQKDERDQDDEADAKTSADL
jgi:hypothetical protein